MAPAVLVVTSPVLLVAVVAIRLDSRGPALFRQERLGRGGRPFTMYKLRTMTVANDDSVHRDYVAAQIRGAPARDGELFKLTSDRRVTRVGRILRRFSVDELPQLWNVVLGDMSLVGPRPPLPFETDLYDQRAWDRLACRPGLTGLWQVSGRSQLTYLEMVGLDLEYLERWSLGLDLKILARTPIVVFSSDAA